MTLHKLFAILSLVIFGNILYSQGLTDTTVQLNEFEIIDQKPEVNPYRIENVGQMEIRKVASRDIGDMLRSEPNISGIRKGGIGIDPVIRGLKFSQLNIQLNNGQKIEGGCPNRMDHPMAHIDPDDIRKIEIIKGPYALRYGPNFGGVVNMKTIHPAYGDRFEVHAGTMLGYESNWNGMKQQLYLSGGTKRYFFNVSGNHKEYGNYRDGNGNSIESSFKKYNITAQAGFRINEEHQVIASFDQSYGRDVMFPALPRDERTDDTRLMSLDYKGKVSETINHLHFKAYHSDVSHEMDNKQRPFSDTVVAVSSIRAINYGFRAEAGIFTGKCQLYAGADYENILKDGLRTKSFILQPTLPVRKELLWDNAFIRNLGLFAEHRKSFTKLDLVSSVRVDFNKAGSGEMIRENMMGQPVYANDSTGSDFINFSISIGATYRFNQKLSVSLALGRGVRSPDMAERFIILLPIGYDRFDYLGNPALKPETNYQADLGLKYYDMDYGKMSVGLFYSWIHDFISGVLLPESVVKPQTKGVLGVKEFNNIGKVHLMGAEVQYNTPDRLKWGIRVTGAATIGINPQALVYTIENGEVTGEKTVENDPLPEIPPLEGKVFAHYKFLSGRLIPELGIRLVSPQNRASEAYYEEGTPGFAVADFRFSYVHNSVFSINGGVQNIFDKAYYEHLNRQIIGSNENFFEPGRVFYVSVRFEI
jgi:iron complex outermembrane receptor protein